MSATLAPPRPRPLAFAPGLESVVRHSELLSKRLDRLMQDVRVTLAVRTVSGEKIQHRRTELRPEVLDLFRPDPDAQQQAQWRAQRLGLRVLRVGRFGITVSGPAALIADICRAPLMVHALARRSRTRSVQDFAANLETPRPSDLFVAPASSLTLPFDRDDAVDNIVFTPPPLYFQPDPVADPPPHGWYGLDEAAVRGLLNVPATYDGAGIRVAMIDTGFHPHPYYAKFRDRIKRVPLPGGTAPESDEAGHGTAMAWNLLAVAPGIELLAIPTSDPPQDAIEEAADRGADIITCSWGYDREEVFPLLQGSILSIIREGRTVIFAAGNGHNAWPASQPEVLSVGGVYADIAGNLQASNYASGFISNIFPDRRSPDVCGLCGQRPSAIYMMLPTQPGSQLDIAHAGPNQDETAPDDGWVGASGTSASAPQVAGVAALLLQKARSSGHTLSPAAIRDHLQQSAQHIAAGRSAMGAPANGQPNIATGWGLVDAAAALASIGPKDGTDDTNGNKK